MIQIRQVAFLSTLHPPEDGFYRGTRFDRSGIFDSILFRGVEMAGRWFMRYDPFMHDAVCGPAEEFAPVGFEAARPGETFLKTGVGLLVRPDEAPYDRFRLYEVADAGKWSVERFRRATVFRHHLDGQYDYTKEVALTGTDSFCIRHRLQVLRPVKTEVYNHNFFTLGRFQVGPDRIWSFPYRPEGDWRDIYDSVVLSEDGVRFLRDLREGESVYMGNLHAAGVPDIPYRLSVSDRATRRGVRISGDVPLTHIVFWADHRIACAEPYNSVVLAPGDTFRWSLRYDLQ